MNILERIKTEEQAQANSRELLYGNLYHRIGLAVSSTAKEITAENEKEIIDKVYTAVKNWLSSEQGSTSE